MSTYKNKLTVSLTIDFDAISGFLSANCTWPTEISRGEYGPNEGIRRIINLLKKNNIVGTCFIPGHTAENYTDQCKMIRDSGFEIGHHGYIHEAPKELSLDGQKIVIEKGLHALDKHLGVKPVGYRAPAFLQTKDTYRILLEHGFEYESSEGAKDSPYFINVDGQKLVEVPSKVILIDSLYFLNHSSNRYFPPPTDPSVAQKIWEEEFTGMYESDENLCFVHVIHPFITGHFSRLRMYERFINFLKNHTDVSFKTLRDISRNFIAKNP
jgi:peptidoglycan-N-acetylglucosamine deacetylase